MTVLPQKFETDILPVQTVAPWCFCCGQENPLGLKLRFRRETDTRISTGLSIPEYWSGWGRIMHGGFHGVLLDEITSWVAFGLLNESSFLTKKIQVRYHRPVYVGQYVHVVGELVENNERTIVVSGEIRDEKDILISDAVSTMIRIRSEHMMRHIKKETTP
ncbi:MAG: PaaI family thioesterase [Desulfomonilia bacterium]